jgi:hypothetical protein
MNGDIAPPFFTSALDGGEWSLVNFTPQPLYRRYLFDMRLVWPWRLFVYFGEKKNLFPLQGIEPRPPSVWIDNTNSN